MDINEVIRRAVEYFGHAHCPSPAPTATAKVVNGVVVVTASCGCRFWKAEGMSGNVTVTLTRHHYDSTNEAHADIYVGPPAPYHLTEEGERMVPGLLENLKKSVALAAKQDGISKIISPPSGWEVIEALLTGSK